MADESDTKGQDPYRKFVDEFLAAASPGLEDVVNSESFGHMLAQTAGNLVAMQRVNNDVMDIMIRNARLAGRADVVALQRQLGRTEDKLESVLDAVERIEDALLAQNRKSAASADQDK